MEGILSTGPTLSNLGLKAPSSTIRAWRPRKDILTKGSLNESVMKLFVEQPVALPGSAK